MSKTPTQKNFYDIAAESPEFDMRHNNAAVATGDGIIVLDFDVKPDKGIDGTAVLAAWDLLGLPHSLRVKTPRGGVHVYLRSPDPEIRNSQNDPEPGVDVRGHHGYVVAPGSSTGDGHYSVIGHVPDQLASCPAFILSQLKRGVTAREDRHLPLTELDTEPAVTSAVEYLTHFAPSAIEGNSGDHATFRVACRLKDIGISAPTAHELMLEHWNETKASPPWDPDELRAKIDNAFSYGSEPPGSKSPAGEFNEELTADQLAQIEESRKKYFERPAYEDQPDITPQAPLALHPFQPYDLSTDVRPRDYVLGKFLARRFVSALISPPGVGKTTFGLTAALAIATGRPLLGPKFQTPTTPRNALYWSQEDDLDEIRMRLSASMRYHGLTFEDTIDPATGQSRLHLFSGVERPLHMAVFANDRRSILPSQDAATLAAYIQEHNIVAAMFDPFLEFHPADENSNAEISRVARIFRKIATATNCAVAIVHHTRKHNAASSETAAGDMDSGRGAGALMGVARVAATLYGCDEKLAKLYRIPPEERNQYVRFDDAKSNLSLISSEATLLKRESVYLAEIDDYVGLLVPSDLRRIDVVVVEPNVFAEDVASVIGRLLARGGLSIGWTVLAEALMRDDFDAAEESPGRYALEKVDSLRKRARRLFDDETGAALAPELSQFVTVSSHKGTFLRFVEEDENP